MNSVVKIWLCSINFVCDFDHKHKNSWKLPTHFWVFFFNLKSAATEIHIYILSNSFTNFIAAKQNNVHYYGAILPTNL
jgi:hypothetical protein